MSTLSQNSVTGLTANIHGNTTRMSVSKSGRQTGGGISPAGTIYITNTEKTDVRKYAYAQILDDNLISENIADGVTILGIEGSHEGGDNLTDVSVVGM